MQGGLLLVLICFLCYGNTISNDYSFDDDIAVTKNPSIQKGIKGIPDILTSPYVTKGQFSVDYRPLSTILLAVEYQFFGYNPHVSHMVNVLCYAVLLLLIFNVLNETFQLGKIHGALPFFVTLFYAVHPVHTEVVASIKNRDEILSMMFAMPVILYSHRFFRDSGKRWASAALALLFMALSLLSKATSLPVLGIILFGGLFFGLHKRGASFYAFLVTLATFVFGYFVLNMLNVKRPMYFIENPLVGNTDFSQNIGGIATTIFFYFKLMFFPHPLRFYYGYNMIPLAPVTNPYVIFSFLIHATLFIYGLLLFRRKQILGLFLLCYLVNIAFYCNIIRYPGIVSERILFIPSLWGIGALGLLLAQVKNAGKADSRFLRKIIVAAGVFVFFIFCGLTIHRNSQWKNTYTLMSADIGHLENSVIANYLYANVLSSRAEKSSAEEQVGYERLVKAHYRRAATLAPEYFEPSFKLGMIYEYEEMNRDSAYYFFRQAYKIRPTDTRAQFQLAKQFYLKGELIESGRLFSDLYRVLPADTFTLYYYTQVLYNLGEVKKALSVNDGLMNLASETYYPYYNYGMIYMFTGDLLNGVDYLEKAINAGYRGQDVYQILHDYYRQNSLQDKAGKLEKIFGG